MIQQSVPALTRIIAGVPVSPTAEAAPGNITTGVLQPNTTETNVSASSLNNTQNQTSIAPVSSKQPVLNESAETIAGNITTGVLQPNTTETNVSASSLNNTQNQTSIAPVSSKQPVLNESAETLAEQQNNVVVSEGDVLLPENRNAVKTLWSGGVVPFKISPAIGNRRSEVEEAFRVISRSTCIRFQQHTNEYNYIHVQDGRGCASFVGCRGGSQPVYFGDTCSVGNLCHELLHAIGLYHEHTRADRDGYVTVHWQKIKPDKKSNFEMRYGDSLNLPYDFDSIMHYGPSYFSIDGSKTLEPKRSGVEIGQRNHLSQLDIQKLNRLYRCGKSGIV
ncbi:high choriolytic enzyme 1 [Leuresthes tenuis]|uniref:high choriolytic enzyme 1 n=1 Tax=Leuresthes tenuis TaxID=355514 RepID=UPI003B5127A0